MLYKKICPYCGKEVQETDSTYYKGDTPVFRFFCDCRDNLEDLRYNENAAYWAYLEEREIANITNFEFYFSDLGTEDEIEERLEIDCEKHGGCCKECPWGKFSYFLSKDEKFPTFDCWKFWEWARKKVKR